MNKKINIILLSAIVISMMVPAALAAPKGDATRIKDGLLTYSAGHYLEGEPLVLGFDEYGYNYQGHMFKGSYANAYLGRDGFPPYEGDDAAYQQRLDDEGITAIPAPWYWDARDVQLIMKWSDAWLSNLDRNDDGSLDRGISEPFDNSAAEGSWITNHMTGVNDDGTHWTYFTKIVAAPTDATVDGGVWFSADGVEIGPVIWTSFVTIQEVTNDPMYDQHGLQYASPYSTGLGVY